VGLTSFDSLQTSNAEPKMGAKAQERRKSILQQAFEEA